ncbi:DUF1496 domain-containing protein [Salmonella enterica subsp. houtenae serovar [1],40:z4,z23:-]
MKKIIMAGLLILPFVASANSIQSSQGKQDNAIDATKAGRQNQNICVYDAKDYSEGAIITVSGKAYMCVNHNKIVTVDEERTFDMRWDRVPDQK